MVKLLLSWDIKPGREGEYFDFIVREFAPRLMKMGIQIVEAWYTIFGNGPQIVTGVVADNLDTLKEILDSDEWRELKTELLEFVTNFQQKVVPVTGRFQL
ncbi:MAG: hypothetical protein DRI61_14670 [Chloroflexi bacterium]|nr:MAG: hypothetical protein DRI61_14670 [Chloroflexota bacterium]HDN79949.1 hypothetical protein [Chloroflexota bacterium]